MEMAEIRLLGQGLPQRGRRMQRLAGEDKTLGTTRILRLITKDEVKKGRRFSCVDLPHLYEPLTKHCSKKVVAKVFRRKIVYTNSRAYERGQESASR